MKNSNQTLEANSIQKMIVDDYRKTFKGKVDDAQIEKNAGYLLSDLTGYAAQSNIVSLIVYAKLQITLTSQPSPNNLSGNAGGIFTPGAGVDFGTIYTSDLPGLLANTTNFFLASTAGYFTVVFFDSNHTSLGSFQGGGPTTVFGTGGGTGTWE